MVSSDSRSEHEVQKLLKFKMLLRRPYVLSASQWYSGHAAAHSDILARRVWLVPTRKTATAETAARNFVSSLFRDVGCPTCSSRTAEHTL